MVGLPDHLQFVQALSKGLEVWTIFGLEFLFKKSLHLLYFLDLCNRSKLYMQPSYS